MQLRVSATPASCPDCGHDVAWHHVRFGRSFGCPTCRTPLRVRGAYTRTLNIAATAIAYLLSYALGLRDWPLIVVGFLGMFPIQIVVTLITLRLFSVEFEATGEFRDILHPADSQIDDDAVPISLPERSPVALKLWELFKDINQPPTLEGYALQFGIVIMTTFVVWSLAVALLHAVFPGFDAARSGQTEVPTTVRVGKSMRSFTNDADISWICRAELGWSASPGLRMIGRPITKVPAVPMLTALRCFSCSASMAGRKDLYPPTLTPVATKKSLRPPIRIPDR
jgi:hypothetical protein